MATSRGVEDQHFAEQIAWRLARIRLWGAVAFFCVALIFGIWVGEPGSRSLLPGLVFYCLAALLLRAGMQRRRLRWPLTTLWPFFDVGFVVSLRLLTVRYEPHPGTTAGWTVAILVLVVMLAALSLGRRLGLVVAGFAFLGGAAMLRAGGVITSLIVATAVALWLAAEGASWAARMLDRAEELGEARKRLEEQHRELLLAQKQAEDLIGFLVHDMKNPLLVATLVLDGVQRRAVDPETRTDLIVVFEQHQRLLGMFSDLIAIARLEKGALAIQLRTTRVSELLAEVAQPHAAYCGSLHIELSADADPELSAEMDKPLVHRALENLVSNALSKVVSGARLRLEARSEGGKVALAVRNTGSEIPIEVRPRLFEKFASDGRSRAHAGLGLYFCRLVAEAHHGTIELEESPEWPVSFVLRLPATEPKRPVNVPRTS